MVEITVIGHDESPTCSQSAACQSGGVVSRVGDYLEPTCLQHDVAPDGNAWAVEGAGRRDAPAAPSSKSSSSEVACERLAQSVLCRSIGNADVELVAIGDVRAWRSCPNARPLERRNQDLEPSLDKLDALVDTDNDWPELRFLAALHSPELTFHRESPAGCAARLSSSTGTAAQDHDVVVTHHMRSEAIEKGT